MKTYTVEQSAIAHWLFSSSKSAVLWLVVRLYVGWEWLYAGWEKLINPDWASGQGVIGFLHGALTKTTGAHPDVQSWYAAFIQNIAIPNATVFAQLVQWGEFLVGVALILGAFVGIASFFGMVLNFAFMLAGAVSINPILLFLEAFLFLARKVAGYWGADRYLRARFRRWM